MGITKPARKIYGNSKMWTKEEEEYLSKYYGKMAGWKIAHKMGRSLSSIFHRANRIGLTSKFANKAKRKPLKRRNNYHWRLLTSEVFVRDNGMCKICEYNKHIHCHHIHPLVDGGSDDKNNLITLCPNHHAEADAGDLSRSDLQKLVMIE